MLCKDQERDPRTEPLAKPGLDDSGVGGPAQINLDEACRTELRRAETSTRARAHAAADCRDWRGFPRAAPPHRRSPPRHARRCWPCRRSGAAGPASASRARSSARRARTGAGRHRRSPGGGSRASCRHRARPTSRPAVCELPRFADGARCRVTDVGRSGMHRGECARTTETEVLVAFFVAFAFVDVCDEVPDAPDVAKRRLCLESQQPAVGRFRCFDEPTKAWLRELDPSPRRQRPSSTWRWAAVPILAGPAPRHNSLKPAPTSGSRSMRKHRGSSGRESGCRTLPPRGRRRRGAHRS